MKLLRDNKSQEEFANTTPYVIMSDPEKSGHTNKAHFITRTPRLASMRRSISMAGQVSEIETGAAT